MVLKNNIYNFFLSINPYIQKLSKKAIYKLSDEWITIPKNKQKFYYKLYWKLLKNQIKQKLYFKERKDLLWILYKSKRFFYLHKNLFKKDKSPNIKSLSLLNSRYFYKNINYNKFNSIKIKGYTIYGENILDFKSKKDNFSFIFTYKKIKYYYKNF